jgi:hypothetical protein
MVRRLYSKFMGSCSVTARLLQVVLEKSPSQTIFLPTEGGLRRRFSTPEVPFFTTSHDSHIDVVIRTGHFLPTYRG